MYNPFWDRYPHGDCNLIQFLQTTNRLQCSLSLKHTVYSKILCKSHFFQISPYWQHVFEHKLVKSLATLTRVIISNDTWFSTIEWQSFWQYCFIATIPILCKRVCKACLSNGNKAKVQMLHDHKTLLEIDKFFAVKASRNLLQTQVQWVQDVTKKK